MYKIVQGVSWIILYCSIFYNLKIKIYRTISLPVVLYGCETWSLTLREERRLRVFENRVLRRVFVSKRDEVTGEWRKLHNEELRDLYSLPNIVRVVKSRLGYYIPTTHTHVTRLICLGDSSHHISAPSYTQSFLIYTL